MGFEEIGSNLNSGCEISWVYFTQLLSVLFSVRRVVFGTFQFKLADRKVPTYVGR